MTEPRAGPRGPRGGGGGGGRPPGGAAGGGPAPPLLVARLREVLRREFGAVDAWVVHTRGRCRLEARYGGRLVVVCDGDEHAFWAPFYTTAVRNRYDHGMLVADLAPTQRRRSDLVHILRPLWERAVTPN
jgi:hypothetical protein